MGLTTAAGAPKIWITISIVATISDRTKCQRCAEQSGRAVAARRERTLERTKAIGGIMPKKPIHEGRTTTSAAIRCVA
ncbi:MAG TPA: hypothetical protein VHR72_08930, partial [Gemmataceae bacterium]|nr:hypothetical protein [Gemmataceae bacterium]